MNAKKAVRIRNLMVTEAMPVLAVEESFVEIAGLITQARQIAVRAVDNALIDLYWRMRQFFDAYRGEPKLSPLLRELPWTHNLIILTQSKRPQERAFCPRKSGNGGAS